VPERHDHQNRDVEVRRLAEHFAETAYGRLGSIASGHGARGEARDEAVQQGLLAFIRFYPGDTADRAGAYSYLARAVQTAALKDLRADRRHARRCAAARDRQEPAGGDPLDAAIAADDVARARRLLAELPIEDRTVLFLGAMGFSPEEIATRLSISKRRVRKVVTRANRRLRELDENSGAPS